MTEQQPHEAVDRPDGFELRCTWRGSYGANRSRRQIAMTAPVTQQEAGWEHPGSLAAAGTRSGPAAGPWPTLLSCPSTARARTDWRSHNGLLTSCRDMTLTPRRRLSSPMGSSGEPSGASSQTLHNT